MHGHFRRIALTACVLLGTLLAPMARAQVRCLSRGQCRQPDSITVLLRPGATDAVLDANFGLVYPSPQGGWRYTCDDIFGGRIPYRTQIARDGRVYVPSMSGLWVGTGGCGWVLATGALSNMAVYDVAFDPKDPQRIWIVGGDPRTVALSTDGGKTFTAKQTFAASLLFIRVAVAPSDPNTIYLSGFNGTKVPLVLAVSTDGGVTWTINDTASMGVATSNQIVDFMGISPDDPSTIFVVVTDAMGDQIWKSTTKGKNMVKVLTLADAEEWPRAGFTFGADGKTVYVAGFDPLNTGMQPPASLYISHDGGMTWDRRTSPMTGPRYRCIAFRDNRLYACAGEQLAGDQFLLGSSADEGKTWAPMMRLTDVAGPNDCAAAKCMGTVDFLRTFSSVDAGAPPIPAPDAGGKPMPPPTTTKSGCSLAGGPGDAGATLLVLILAGLVARRRRGGG
jgi:MYXO-CTERM domain-containing protein